MKKYIRLFLISVAIFSVAIMLVYRYKYQNLLAFIEFMKMLSSSKARSTKCPPKHLNNLTSEVSFNINHWTEIFDGVYIYSLHVISGHIISLAYSNSVSVIEMKSIKCSLLLDHENNIQSNIAVHQLSGKSTAFLYYIECKNIYDFGNPNAVTFVKNNISVTLPVFHKPQYTGPFAACVSPLSQVFSDESKILEFLIYHSHLGIKHFLLYYSSFSAAIRELLIKIAFECDIIIEFLPWITPPNFEHKKINLQPYFIDCIFHISSLNHSDFVFLFDLNTFMVLEQAPDLNKFVYDNSPFDFLKVGNRLFCLEYPSDLIAKELKISFNTLLKTKVSDKESQQMNMIYNIKQMMAKIPEGFERWLLIKNQQNFRKIKLASASIFSYVHCGINSQNTSVVSYTENKKMWSFRKIFFDSCIYKQWNH